MKHSKLFVCCLHFSRFAYYFTFVFPSVFDLCLSWFVCFIVEFKSILCSKTITNISTDYISNKNKKENITVTINIIVLRFVKSSCSPLLMST